VTSLRHIEAQVLRDTHGNTRVLGLRDCSVQRNNQKLLEESGSTLLGEALREEVFRCAASIAEKVDYIGAGTVEFIFDVPSQAVYFMEMNTRLQVEHPVTEATTGIDIVAEQFKIASGESIEAMEPQETGYAIEARINAERASIDAMGQVTFQPTPGRITRCELPEREGITLISMAAADKMVSPFYDSLIIQVIAEGSDRNDAVANLESYLDDVVIEGINTNIALIKRILRDEVFLGGDYDTTYLPGFLGRTDVHSLIEEIDEAAGSRASDLTLESLTIEDSGEIRVLAPSTGVFFRTPSPSEPEYVNLGDVVSVDDVLCVLEAMKMFAPFRLSAYASAAGELYPSNQKYRVTRSNVTSGQAVTEGDLLFVVEPVPDV
jgi:acetyl/propionyl-CoA carboxylase alpha subunit